jgi:hypothetical protein
MSQFLTYLDGSKYVRKFGRNKDLDVGGGDIWDGTGFWVAPVGDVVHNIASTSADDASPSGTGARVITIQGLSGGLLTGENVALNGTSDVPTVNAYSIIHRMFIASGFGSGSAAGGNQGDITATTDDVAATVTAQINTGFGQTAMAIFRIPSNNVGMLKSYYLALNSQVTSAGSNFILSISGDGELFSRSRHLLGTEASGSSYIRHPFDPPILISPGDTVRIAAFPSANNLDVSAGFDIDLVQGDIT